MVQEDYEAACLNVFDALDKMEQRLEGQRYLIPYHPAGQAAPSPTLADYRLFTTLIRFDVVYYLLFKTNVKHIRDYPNLQVPCCHPNIVDSASPPPPPFTPFLGPCQSPRKGSKGLAPCCADIDLHVDVCVWLPG